jgi:NAD-dependent dihydropyrimidine dehydrogenase PreA subunit
MQSCVPDFKLQTEIMGKRYKNFEVYLVHIDPDKCDGCEECVRFCPVDVFDMAHKATVARPQNCLGCRTCAAVCKSKAIIITEI